MSTIDPVLLTFITQLTQSGRERWRKHFQEDSEILSAKRNRQFYALCVLLFCTNSTCSMPFHVILTEAVLCHGGSLELVRILNRVRAIASLDTNNRLATHIVQERINQGIIPQLVPNALTILSIDNIDILQTYAIVSCTDKTRSWHGTSVQCVKPLPMSASLSQDELLESNGASSKRPVTSPVNSPMPVEKCKRRRRTLTEKPSPHSHVTLPSIRNSDTSSLSHNYESEPLPD